MYKRQEKNFVVQFAFRSGSKEDTISLIEALAHSADKAESDEIMVTYRAKYDMKPAWVEQVENLLVALEMYRVEEEKAINHLADILTAYGIDVSAEEIRTTETCLLYTSSTPNILVLFTRSAINEDKGNKTECSKCRKKSHTHEGFACYKCF